MRQTGSGTVYGSGIEAYARPVDAAACVVGPLQLGIPSPLRVGSLQMLPVVATFGIDAIAGYRWLAVSRESSLSGSIDGDVLHGRVLVSLIDIPSPVMLVAFPFTWIPAVGHICDDLDAESNKSSVCRS